MPGLVPGIHVVPSMPNDVDGRDKPGHDDVETGERKTPIVNAIAQRLTWTVGVVPRPASSPNIPLANF